MTEDEMVGQHHQLNRHEFEQTLGDSVGQGSLACCDPCGHKQLDTTNQLNNNNNLSAPQKTDALSPVDVEFLKLPNKRK